MYLEGRTVSMQGSRKVIPVNALRKYLCMLNVRPDTRIDTYYTSLHTGERGRTLSNAQDINFNAGMRVSVLFSAYASIISVGMYQPDGTDTLLH